MKRYKCIGSASFLSMNYSFGISAKKYEEARIKAIKYLLKLQDKESLQWEKDFADANDLNNPLEIEVKVEEV